MTHPAEQFLSQILGALTDAAPEGKVENDTPLVPDMESIYFSWDPKFRGTVLTLGPADGALFVLNQTVKGEPGWLTLNFPLGPARFEPGDVLGFVVRMSGFEGHEIPLFIRTAHGDLREDTNLQEPLLGASNAAVRTVLHTVDAADPLVGGNGYHTLVVSLPKTSGTLSLYEFGLWVLPAARGLRSQPETLASIA